MEFIIERGYRVKEVDRREGSDDWDSRLVAVDKERQRRKRWEMISGLKYNR